MKETNFFYMLDVANEKLKKFFRQQRRESIKNRKGAILLVDDFKEQEELLRYMLDVKKYPNDLVVARGAREAKAIIKKTADDLRIVIIDIELFGVNNNIYGIDLMRWMDDNYPDIPYIVLTGRQDVVPFIEENIPGVDVIVKGKNTINDFADAIGLIDTSYGGNYVPEDKNQI